MLALVLEITVVLAWFIWAYYRQARAHREANRPPPHQLRLSLGKELPNRVRSSDVESKIGSRSNLQRIRFMDFSAEGTQEISRRRKPPDLSPKNG
jgi:hypothetical protein